MRKALLLAMLWPLSLAVALACDAESTGSVAPEALAERIASGDAPAVLDVRSREEYAAGHVPGAILVPHDELAGRLAELPFAKSDEVVVHCQSGRRAELAGGVLKDAGYTRVRELEGHWAAWQAAGLPRE